MRTRKQDAFFCAECGTELTDGAYTWDTGGYEELICPYCFDGRFGELSRRERAELIGSRYLAPESAGVNVDEAGLYF